jgi:hypothetical protein
MIFKYLYQYASAHTHCLITFLKNVRSSERGAYSIDSGPIVNSKKVNNLDYFLTRFFVENLHLNLSVGSAHSTDRRETVNKNL